MVKNMKIREKILLIIILLIILTSVGSIFISRNISMNIIRKQISNNLINITLSRAEQIKMFLDLEKDMVEQLSGSIAIREFLLAKKGEQDYFLKLDKVMEMLKYTFSLAEYGFDIFILDKKGIIIASSDKENIGEDKSNNSYFLGGKEGASIKDAYISSDIQQKTLAFSSPILNEEDNGFFGVVVLRVFPERLFRITIERTGLGRTGETYLVNKDGYMITPSRFIDDVFLKQKINLVQIEKLNHVKPFDTSREEKAGIIKNYRGVEVLTAITNIPEMGWQLIAHIDTKEAFAPVTQMTNALLLIFIIILFTGLFVSNITSRSITAPLRKLNDGTEEITKGNLDYKVGNSSPDEVGQLSRAFDEMSFNLKKSREELEDYSRNLEQKIKERTAQLESSIKEIESFSYSVSHDLQAPLRAISGFSEILMKDYHNTLDDKGQHYLQRVKAGAKNMSQIIEDLLVISRVARKPINKKKIDLGNLSKKVYSQLFEEEKKKRKIDFTVQSCPPANADSQLMTIALINLFSNALKFTRKCKKTQIEFGHKIENNKTIYFVKDNGVGFNMKYSDRLFNPFQRLHSAEEFEGTGIGLTTVQRIIHRHGGKIWVDSTPGSGTTFYFIL